MRHPLRGFDNANFLLRTTLAALSILTVIAFGLHFRTYELGLWQPQGQKSERQKVEDFVRKGVRAQLERISNQRYPDMNPVERQKWIESQIDLVIRQDRNQFETVVAQMLSRTDKEPSQNRRHYLLEADPYHYFQLTEKIVATGRLSDRVEKGRYFNPLRHAPFGEWSPINLHPYTGAFLYRFVRLFKGDADLMEVCAYVPLMLMALTVMVYYFLCRTLGIGIFGFLTSGLSLVLAPVYLQRSRFGWYDTDPYNYLFPFMVLIFFFRGSRSSLIPAFLWAIGAGIVTALYALFWLGWPFIYVLILVSGMMIALFRQICPDVGMARVFPFTIVYGLSVICFAMVLLSPGTFYQTVLENASFLPRFASAAHDVWPDVFITVGEAGAVTFRKLIFLTGNPIVFGLALWGVAWGFLRACRRSERHFAVPLIVLTVMWSPLMVLALKTERFSLLFVMPVVMFLGLGADSALRGLGELCVRYLNIPVLPHLLRTVLVAGILGLMLPLQMVLAHFSAEKDESIMNDAWYRVLNHIRTQTPQESIVSTWWAPGHFVTALADRRVFADGGTQHLPESYWLGRFFMAEHESEGLGILRMLHAGGNRAVEYLRNDLAFSLSESVDILNEIFGLPRARAERSLVRKMGRELRGELLDHVYGSGNLPPAIVLIYDEMVEKNLSISILARWDFKRAENLLGKQTPASVPHNRQQYIQDIVKLEQGILRYRPAAELDREENGWLIFKNGLRVNLVAGEAALQLDGENLEGHPLSLFVLREDELAEIPYDGKRVDISALVYEENGVWMAVLADRALIRSLLFRLYYLNGKSLRFFKPLIQDEDLVSKTRLKVYEVDWAAFNEHDAKATNRKENAA